MKKNEKVRDHLGAALDQLLAALALAGGDIGQAVPTDGLDAAVASDVSVREARVAFHVALRGLETSGTDGDRHQAVLTVEAAANALVAESADAAYRLGVRVGRGLQARS